VLNALSILAASEGSGPSVHITPGELFNIYGYSITNSMFYGAISSVIILFLLIIVARRARIQPKGGITQFVEIGTTFIVDLLASALGSREKALKYGPWFVSLFFFIILTNWIGLLPGVGETFTINGTPVGRPFTADLNGTLAAATVVWVMVQYFAIRESGLLRHIRHYFNGSMKNPITLLLGIFEMFSDVTRIFSLALRLFLNVVIGETIIAVFAYLGGATSSVPFLPYTIAPLAALPFTVLELLVGALQAYIFVMLSVMYLAVAIKHDEHSEQEPSVEEVLAVEAKS
jgi:F-type H+-transporting ATPase subunit a